MLCPYRKKVVKHECPKGYSDKTGYTEVWMMECSTNCMAYNQDEKTCKLIENRMEVR